MIEVDTAPALFSYWLIIPAVLTLGLAWVWDGTEKDKRESIGIMFWMFVVLLLARYLP